MQVASEVQWVKRRTSTRLRIFEILFFIRCFFHVINGKSFFSFSFFFSTIYVIQEFPFLKWR